MSGRGKDTLDKNNDALTSFVKTGSCVEDLKQFTNTRLNSTAPVQAKVAESEQ